MSATKQFVDYVRSDAELRRAYLGMLDEVRAEVVEILAVAPAWDEFNRRRGRLDALQSLRNEIQMEEREHAARRDYDSRSGH